MTTKLKVAKHESRLENITAACKTLVYLGFILCIICYFLLTISGVGGAIHIGRNGSETYASQGVYVLKYDGTFHLSITHMAIAILALLGLAIFTILPGLIMTMTNKVELTKHSDRTVIAMSWTILILIIAIAIALFAAVPYHKIGIDNDIEDWNVFKTGNFKWDLITPSVTGQTYTGEGFTLIIISIIGGATTFFLFVRSFIKSLGAKALKYPTI